MHPPTPTDTPITVGPTTGAPSLNHAIHIAAVTQLRHDTTGRIYYRKKIGEGKTPKEAIRALKRRISDAVYKSLIADAAARTTN
jgi:hypothetical protein